MSRPPHQIIYTHGGGRLGNQVIRFAHWIAWVLENAGEVEVLDLGFWPHAHDFAVWRRHPGCVFPPRDGGADRWAARFPGLLRALEKNTRLPRAVQAAGRRWPGWQAIDLDIAREDSLALDRTLLSRVKQRAVTTICGWRIANWPLVEKHTVAVRECFRPAAEHAHAAADFVSSLRRAHDLIIGVQIRQTDYRAWHDGRFLFPVGKYATWLREIVALHPGRRVAFVLTSEVVHDPAVFAGLTVFFGGGSANTGGPAIRSWAELALCDVIVSPPSTFSATAAWAGGVPLWPLAAAEQAMSRGQIFSGGIVAAARHPLFSLAVK